VRFVTPVAAPVNRGAGAVMVIIVTIPAPDMAIAAKSKTAITLFDIFTIFLLL
jgi:hypothetical protein